MVRLKAWEESKTKATHISYLSFRFSRYLCSETSLFTRPSPSKDSPKTVEGEKSEGANACEHVMKKRVVTINSVIGEMEEIAALALTVYAQ